jgi:FkbM family methyltransferase
MLSAEQCVPYRLAVLAHRYSPRGKGAIPRLLGKLVPELTYYLRLDSGIDLVVSPGSLDTFAHLSLRGNWEEHVLNVCKHLLSEGDVFYDIGANIGYMTTNVAAHFSDAVRIEAFEPQPQLARAIRASAHLNGFRNIAVHNSIVADSNGIGTLFVPSHATHASVVARSARAQQIACTTRTIDSLVDDGSIPSPQVIKMDVEGAEMRCLKGAEKTIGTNHPDLVMEADMNMARFGYGIGEVATFLRRLAPYTLFAFDHDKRVVELRDYRSFAGNVVATCRHDLSWFDCRMNVASRHSGNRP